MAAPSRRDLGQGLIQWPRVLYSQQVVGLIQQPRFLLKLHCTRKSRSPMAGSQQELNTLQGNFLKNL